MYAETGLMFPCSHDFPQFQKFDEVYFPENLHAPSEVMGSLVQTPSTMPDYYVGEGDLFEAPQPILEEPLAYLDPTSLAIPDIELSGQLLSDVYYECKKDLLAKVIGIGNETSAALSSEVVSNEIQTVEMFRTADQNKLLLAEAPPIQKSVSTSCLRSMDVGRESVLRPHFIDFSLLDFGAVNGMRRAYSDGDIQNLGDGNNNNTSSTQQTPMTTMLLPSNAIFAREDRKEKLSRYRQKRSKRNFGRKIKYACRKALADSQPRIRGRFAKTEDVVDVSTKMQ